MSLLVGMYSEDGIDVILGASKIKCLFCHSFHLIQNYVSSIRQAQKDSHDLLLYVILTNQWALVI